MPAGQHVRTSTICTSFCWAACPRTSANSVQVHLAACAACLGTVENLQADDTLVGAMRAPRREVTAADGQQVAALIHKLSGISRLPEASADQVARRHQPRSRSSRATCWRRLRMPTKSAGSALSRAQGAGRGRHGHRLRGRRSAAQAPRGPEGDEAGAGPDSRQPASDFSARPRRPPRSSTITSSRSTRSARTAACRSWPCSCSRARRWKTRSGERRASALPVTVAAQLNVLRIAREIAAGLAAAHAQGLTHRDIKPANIWLEKTGRVKILDFGLARPEQDDAHLTQTGIIAGTPQYMAPEQAAGQPVDHLSDLFSLGCVLYRLLTGRLPFRGPSTMAVLRALALDQPQPPHEVNPEVPRALSDLTMRLLAKEPHNRPQSADDVVQELARIEKAVATLRVPSRQTAHGVCLLRDSAASLIVAASLLLLAGPSPPGTPPPIYRIATNQGLLIIQTDDPAVEVTVKQNGELIKIVDRKTGREVTLKAGIYQLELSGDKETGAQARNQSVHAHARRPRNRPRPAGTCGSAGPCPGDRNAASIATFPFVVLSSGEQAEQKFATLAEAVAAAKSGDTIEIRGNGPFVLQPIDLADKALTLRAGTGAWPVLSLAPEAVQADLPLLTTRAALTLEGLEFHRDAGGKPGATSLRHIHSERAPLAVANCRFVLPSRHPGLIAAIMADGSPAVQVHNCLFLGDWHAGPSCVRGRYRRPHGRCQLSVSDQGHCGLTASSSRRKSHRVLACAEQHDDQHGDPVSIAIGLGKPPRRTWGRLRFGSKHGGTLARPVSSTSLYYSSSKETDEYFEREMRSLPPRLFTLEDQGNHIADRLASRDLPHASA